MIFCQALDLPRPPPELLAELTQQISGGDLIQISRQAERFKAMPEFLQRSVTLDQITTISRVQKRYEIPQALVLWAQNHLPAGMLDFNLSISEGGALHGPHVDYNRHYSLIYLLHTGGTAVTSWWQKRGFPVEFKSLEWPATSSDYADLDLLFQQTLLPGSWYVLNTWVYHSVENITGPRISLQGDFLEAPI